MAKYTLVRTCTTCGFSHRTEVLVCGSFDGWDEDDRKMTSETCPFCNHAKKLGMSANIAELGSALREKSQNIKILSIVEDYLKDSSSRLERVMGKITRIKEEN